MKKQVSKQRSKQVQPREDSAPGKPTLAQARAISSAKRREASERAGQFSLETTHSWEPTPLPDAEGHDDAASKAEKAASFPPGLQRSARSQTIHARKPGDLRGASLQPSGSTQPREGSSRNARSQASEESDAFVVAEKSSNSWVTPEETMERRNAADGEIRERKRTPDSAPDTCANTISRIGERAKRNKGERFTNLLSHMTAALLKIAYMRLRKNAATGIDNETWEMFGENLDERLLDLEDRIHRGSYHPQPVRRVYIPKVDGSRRPLGIPSLEDKVVQQAARMLMEPIYEASEFKGFSYGFRPGRSPHKALDALAIAISKKKVSWVLDADIRAFFDTIDHAWMQKFVEHRIGDKRLVRLLTKWLHAGVMEGGELREVEEGTPQGGIISPLLANIFLHYALDLWVQQWRTRHARGEVYFVRYADDFVMGFQYESDARAMREALASRLSSFGLELHPDKTRVIRFGRFAKDGCAKDGRNKPETFDFLGFTHTCAWNERGWLVLMRRTSRKKRQAKLEELTAELRRRRHEPVVVQHRWLTAVVRGHVNYYGVPTNSRALRSFRDALRHAWHHSLQRRSQRAAWTNEQIGRFDRTFPLPPARICRPWPTLPHSRP
jgi:RNA-directed DNA polymerase